MQQQRLPASLAQDLRIQKPKGPLFICEVSDNSLHTLIQVPMSHAVPSTANGCDVKKVTHLVISRSCYVTRCVNLLQCRRMDK
jgi:hypothetical protein